MKKEEIKEKINLFNNNKISWVDLAPFLIYAKDFEMDLSDFELDPRKINSFVKSYKFLEVQRPESLKDENLKRTPSEIISYLPFIYRKMNEEERKNDFQELIDNVLKRKISLSQMKKISKQLKKKYQEKNIDPNERKVTKESFYLPRPTLEIFQSSLEILRYMIEKILKENNIEEVRKVVREDCRDLSNQLQCIADEDFYKLWKERKEFKI